MSKLLENKKIVIIGGTSGIGLSAANYFVQQGGQVIAFGLPSDDLSNSENCKFLIGDALDKSKVEETIDFCVESFGGFDALYHVAGGSGRKWGDGPLHEITDEGWDRTINLNMKSVMISNRAAVNYFINKKQEGVLLNTSTVLAYSPSSKFFHTHAYAAAKAGIIGLSKSIASYYAPQNIRVNVLAPALTKTPMAARASERDDIQDFIKTKQPLDNGRMAMANDLDAAACYFLSDAASFTTGQVLAVDGGWSVSEGQYQ